MEKLTLSTLGHTWILDLDGTIVRHNGYKIDGYDTLLPGAKEFLNGIPEKDMVLFITSREVAERDRTIAFLRANDIRFDHIVFNAPYGERVVVNDCKPSGLATSVAVNVLRDGDLKLEIVEDPSL